MTMTVAFCLPPELHVYLSGYIRVAVQPGVIRLKFVSGMGSVVSAYQALCLGDECARV